MTKVNVVQSSMSPSIATPPEWLGQSERRDRVPLGITFMVLATFMFALSSAISKLAVAKYPVGEVMFFRSISSLLACAAFILPKQGLVVLATKRIRSHLARGLSQSISQTFTVLALSMMPLSGAIAISFSAPLWAAMLSILWLKESSTRARWTALFVGLLGVLIVTHPGTDSLQVGALFALANAVMYGSVTVAVRGMTKTENANTLLMWQMITLAMFHTLLLVFGFRFPTQADLVILCASGIANAFGQYCWTHALYLAPATAVGPFYYLILAWALLIRFIGWHEIPTLYLLVGSGIVVASSLFLLLNEVKKRKS